MGGATGGAGPPVGGASLPFWAPTAFGCEVHRLRQSSKRLLAVQMGTLGSRTGLTCPGPH